MNAAHFHLVVNHFPIILPFVGLSMIIAGLIFRSDVLKRTAFVVFICAGIAVIFAMNSGEGAEETIEEMVGVDENRIKAHEEKAETFAVLCYVLASLSLIGLWANLKQKSFAQTILILTTICSVVVLFFAKQTGTSGGEIRHEEIRENNSLKPTNSSADED
jgi:uncharacterized membrane protein